MKKLITLFLCLFVFAAVGCKKDSSKTLASNESVKKTFTMGLDDGFPPMGFRDDNNNIVGFDIDLAKEVTKRLNMELVLQPIDWASKELELNKGKIDCIWNGLSVDPARAQAMLLTKPYFANNMVIVVKKDSPIVSKNMLVGKNIGAQNGSTAVKAYERDSISKDAKFNGYENNVLALSELSIGRIDGVVMDEVVAKYLITKTNAPYKTLEQTLAKEDYAIGFKKGNNALAEKVEKAIDEMVADGTFDNITTKWFGTNTNGVK